MPALETPIGDDRLRSVAAAVDTIQGIASECCEREWNGESAPDTGYASEVTLRELENRNIAACVALGREGNIVRGLNALKYPAKARMAECLKTPEELAHYRRRKVIPEPVFGWIKHILGFRRASKRGLERVTGEWDLICLAVNLKRINTLGWAPA